MSMQLQIVHVWATHINAFGWCTFVYWFEFSFPICDGGSHWHVITLCSSAIWKKVDASSIQTTEARDTCPMVLWFNTIFDVRSHPSLDASGQSPSLTTSESRGEGLYNVIIHLYMSAQLHVPRTHVTHVQFCITGIRWENSPVSSLGRRHLPASGRLQRLQQRLR